MNNLIKSQEFEIENGKLRSLPFKTELKYLDLIDRSDMISIKIDDVRMFISKENGGTFIEDADGIIWGFNYELISYKKLLMI
jgi:hypothetical protein